VLDPNHEDDIVPVILEEPDHHGALSVTLHVGHRLGDVERVPIRRTATASVIRDARLSTWSIWAWASPPTTLAASGTYSHVQSLMP
jgi:hypothetical protein